MIEFKVEYNITAEDGTNKFWAGMHWSKRKQFAEKWRVLVRNSMRKIPHRTFEKRVYMDFVFVSRLDADGHAMIQKEIIDTLVVDKWLVNDNKKHVLGYSTRHKTDRDDMPHKGVMVKIWEVDE